uniref:Uncharacterized protein n=1 Tax=Sphaerodactylus townsendi TaxID=933632 RepID=A0ACB8FQD4_9SAUR
MRRPTKIITTQKVEEELGSALASFLLLLLGDGAIEANNVPRANSASGQFHQPTRPRRDRLSPRVIPKRTIFQKRPQGRASTTPGSRGQPLQPSQTKGRLETYLLLPQPLHYRLGKDPWNCLEKENGPSFDKATKQNIQYFKN